MDTQPPSLGFCPSHDTVQGTQEGTPRKVPGHGDALAGMGGNVAEPRGAEEPLASPAGGLEVSAPLGRELVQTGAGAGPLTRPTFRVLLSSSGIGRYTASATQLAKMVRRMIVSKGLAPRLRRALS